MILQFTYIQTMCTYTTASSGCAVRYDNHRKTKLTCLSESSNGRTSVPRITGLYSVAAYGVACRDLRNGGMDPQIFGGAATDIVDVSTRVDRRMFEWTGRLVALSSSQPRLGDYINQSGNGDHWRLQVPDLAPISTPHQRAAAGSATALLIAEN